MKKNIKTSSFQNYFITCTHKDISMLEDSNENFTIEDLHMKKAEFEKLEEKDRTITAELQEEVERD